MERTAAVESLIQDRIAIWRKQLLDFSWSNRMVYYRPGSTSLRLKVDDDTLWRTIVVDRRPLALTAAVLGIADNAPATDTEPTLLYDAPEAADAQPRRRAAARGTPSERMQLTLRSLQEKARVFLEEQGVHVLHLCFGTLDWPDATRPPGDRDRVVVLNGSNRARLVTSPLIFVPVRLLRQGTAWSIEREDADDIEPNLALASYLRDMDGVDLPIFDADDDTLAGYLDAVERRIAGRQHWALARTDTALLDVFSFKKVALLRALDRSTDLIEQQPVLRALAGDSTLLNAEPDAPSDGPIDTRVPAGSLALVVDADSSQVEAIAKVAAGSSLVIQGPPGTGKSQTITNLISSLLAKGKRVLFVAEKKAARDVVVGNLASAGLADLVLHITEDVAMGRTSTAKRDILEQFRLVLEAGPRHYATDDQIAHAVQSSQAHLSRYANLLHRPMTGGMSPFELIERWAASRRELVPANPPSAPDRQSVDASWERSVRDAAIELGSLGDVAFLAATPGPWHSDESLDLTDVRPHEVRADLSRIVAYPVELRRIAAQIGYAATTWTALQVGELDRHLVSMARYNALQGSLLRFFQPAYWSARSHVNAFVASGGMIPPNAREAAESLAALIADWTRATAVISRLAPLTFDDADDTGRQAENLLNTFVQFDARREVASVFDRTHVDGRARRFLLDLLPQANGGAPFPDVVEAVLARQWAREVADLPELALTSELHRRFQQDFRVADGNLKRENLKRALQGFAANRPALDIAVPPTSDLGKLRGQIQAKRRKPLRWLFANAPDAILRLKPCIVCSPLAVGQLLSHDAYRFDTVLFDEASQIPTADAVVAMAHARQVVVAGDSKQMPPTAFFERSIQGAADDADDTQEPQFESLLDECAAKLKARMLQWHYRSRDDRLIAFSNEQFYDGRLLTFPASWSEHPDFGVKFAYVADAVYGRGGSRSNPQEADRVVALLGEELARHPESVVAVTAMSAAQQAEIQARIEAAAATSDAIAEWRTENRVKNLETVQGDECDVMILSFGYGKDAAGNVVLNFGPLSSENGGRRLNVAVTRARYKTIVVASIRAADIPQARVGVGGALVRAYLDYAERGPIALAAATTVSSTSHYDSPFEEEVAQALRGLGYTIDTQVGVGTYRIDLAVQDPAAPGRYLAGIECDGATYHSAQSARDRDIVRQQVLERLGWTILRVWSPDWFRRRDIVLGRLHGDLQALASAEPARTDRHVDPDAATPAFGTMIDPFADRALPAPIDGIMIDPFAKEALPALAAGTVRYVPHRPNRVVMPLPRHVAILVASEGPLHIEEAVAALRDDEGFERAGSQLRSRYLQAIEQASVAGWVRSQGAWLWPPALSPREVIVRVSEAEKRRFEHYPDEELIRAVAIASARVGRMADGDLIEATARLLGYNVSQQIRRRLEQVVLLAEQQRVVERVGGQLAASQS